MPKSSTPVLGVPSVAPFSVACHYLGAPTAAALRRRIQRGLLPASIVLDAGPRLRLIDVEAGLAFLRGRHQGAQAEKATEAGT